MPAPLPEMDLPRRRLRLSEQHLRVLRGLLEDVPPADEATAAATRELQQAGLLLGDHVEPLLLDLVRVLVAPTLQLVVEVVGPAGPTLADVVVSGTDVWSTDPWPSAAPDDPVTWVRSELPTLLWDVARLVGLRSTPLVPDTEPVHADLASVDGLLAVLATADPGRPVPALTTVLAQSETLLGHLEPVSRLRWTTLLASWQASWRVSVAWGDQTRGIAVMDCGDQGYWRREDPSEPVHPAQVTGSTPVLLHPTDARRLWRDLGGLLPSSEELRSAAARATAAP